MPNHASAACSDGGSLEGPERNRAIALALDDGEAAEQERKRPSGTAWQAFEQEPRAEGREHRQCEKGNDDRPPGDAQAVETGHDAAQPVVRPARHQPHAVDGRFRPERKGNAHHITAAATGSSISMRGRDRTWKISSRPATITTTAAKK